MFSWCSTDRNIVSPMIENNEITNTNNELWNNLLLHKDYSIVPIRWWSWEWYELWDSAIILTPELEQFIEVDNSGNIFIDNRYTGFREWDILTSWPTSKFPNWLLIEIKRIHR